MGGWPCSTRPDSWHYCGSGHLSRGGPWVALTDGSGGVTIVIEKQSWEDTNQEQWKSKYFPMGYTTEEEVLSFTLHGLPVGGQGRRSSSSSAAAGEQEGGASPSSGGLRLGVWRSLFCAVSESIDPTGWANVSTNTSFLVREPDLIGRRLDLTAAGAGAGTAAVADAEAVVFTVRIGINDIVTLSTRVDGVPASAPVLPRPPATATDDGCTFPRQLEDDFDHRHR